MPEASGDRSSRTFAKEMSLRSNRICGDANASMIVTPSAKANMVRLRGAAETMPGRPLRFNCARSVKGGPTRKGKSSGVRPLHPAPTRLTLSVEEHSMMLRAIHQSPSVPTIPERKIKCEQTGPANPHPAALSRLRTSGTSPAEQALVPEASGDS